MFTRIHPDELLATLNCAFISSVEFGGMDPGLDETHLVQVSADCGTRLTVLFVRPICITSLENILPYITSSSIILRHSINITKSP